MLLPYRADVPMYRWPIANWVILAVIVACFGVEHVAATEAIQPYVLNGWGIRGLVGHMFLHDGVLHLLGNLIFLAVFGDAVCARVGSVAYSVIFIGLGLLAAVTHNVVDGASAVGASGAINGIVGMFLVWFPLANIRIVYFFLLRVVTTQAASFWLILLWLVFDIWGAATGAEGVAYWAHLGGFVGGVALAMGLSLRGWVEHDDSEEQPLPRLLGLGRWRGEWDPKRVREKAPQPVAGPVQAHRPAIRPHDRIEPAPRPAPETYAPARVPTVDRGESRFPPVESRDGSLDGWPDLNDQG